MDLSWMNAATEKISPTEANPRRGLTYRDLDVGSYGFTDVPEKVRRIDRMRRAAAEIPEGVARFRSRGSRAKRLWAFTREHYEEAVSRQWNAHPDIPVGTLEGVELPGVTGKALFAL